MPANEILALNITMGNSLRTLIERGLRLGIASQVWLSRTFDMLFPLGYRLDGKSQYQQVIVPQYLKHGQVVYEVGGGMTPVLSAKQKEQFAFHIVGLDIDARALELAPEGIYDSVICADIAGYAGTAEADLVLCRAVFEHIPDIEQAFAGIASLIKPDGVIVLFTPSRNALFARLNLVLPESAKRWLLYTIFPYTKRGQGFPSYYRRCTPQDFEELGKQSGLYVESRWLYFMSAYFSCCFPCYVVWRLWTLCFRLLAGGQAAETFTITFKKLPTNHDA